jgi:hypothetical protein
MLFEEIRVDDTVCYKSKEGVVFVRFKGGVKWPDKKPAFVAVLGEEYSLDAKYPTLRLLFEHYEASMDNLAKLCASLQDQYYLNSWTADCEREKEGYPRYLDEWCDRQNRSDPMKKLSFLFYQPGLTNDFALSMARLNRRFRQNALILKKEGILEGKIKGLRQEDLEQTDLEVKYPEVTLLAEIVFEFDTSPFNPTDTYNGRAGNYINHPQGWMM